MIKTCDLDPKKQYFFLLHPHGILSEGFGFNMCTMIGQREFAAAFPGIPWKACGSARIKYFPGVREAFFFGACCVVICCVSYVLCL